MNRLTSTSRQILADLDAVGNTTKAITKGIAIGSAVIAAVSLFSSFIVTVGSGGKGENVAITPEAYTGVANMLTVSNPTLFIGLLIGGAVPFLFSSMTIRAVGRAAFLIVKECRIQFRDKEIWEGTQETQLRPRSGYLHHRGTKGIGRTRLRWRCLCRSLSDSRWARLAWRASWRG